MAKQGAIADVLLVQLAEDIETGEQMEALGRALGFKAAAINRYIDTSSKGDRATCEGTRDMLFNWRQTVKPCDQHLRLEQALIDAKLVMLADTHLKGTPSIGDIYSEKISESLTVQQCREKLEKKYLDQLCKIQMKPWDHADYAEFEDMHTAVTIVKKDAYGKDTNEKEILQSSVADIFSTKVNGKLPARILISAPAGKGKTTAVAKMAYDWVHMKRGSALEHLPLLFVVKFWKTNELTSIGEAIKSQLLSDVDDLTPEGLESFIRKNQGICHIILDGLDEYVGISSSQSSSLSNIVSVIRLEELPECRVLVTTRPHLENFFNQDDLSRVYTTMWIEGFSRESSCEYIDKFFASTSNPCAGQSLKNYLDEQPLIDELVKTPLFCLMICHLLSEDRLNSGTTTQTELLDSMNFCIMHHANARSNVRVISTHKELRKIISQLGEVALTGLLDDANKIVFTPHDFRKIPAILEKACQLGIVSVTTVYIKCPPQSKETTSTTIEFYHKLAQEHMAGKFIADQSTHFQLRLKISKLDRVLRKIKANIGDYENLIRFAAGSDNSLCIRIMEELLSNSRLHKSEQYRIILDCLSETKGTEGNVSSLVQRCVNAQSIALKAPTVYTVVGMQNLPKQLKRKVRSVNFEGCTLTTDVTSGLWSCLGSFTSLNQLAISDSSLSFPPSPPELPSVTELSVERVTSQSYEGLLSSLPGLRNINITIDDAERDISQITAGICRTGGQQLTAIRLKAPTSLPLAKKEISKETMRGLGLMIREHTKNLQWLGLSGMKCLDEEDLVELFEPSTYLKLLDSLQLQSIDDECFHYDRESDVEWLYFTRREHEKVLEGFARRTEEVLPSTTKTSPGETVSSSQRPLNSTSVGIPLPDESEAAREVSTSQASCSMVTSDGNECDGLQNAAWKGKNESICSLVEDGRDIDGQVEGNSKENAIVNKADNNSGFSPNLAVELQNGEVMKVPLASAAQPDALNNEGKGTPHDACIEGDVNAIKLVINAGADVDIKSNDHSTPLLLAAEKGHNSSVEKLLTHGADPQQIGNGGDSLIYNASSGCSMVTSDSNECGGLQNAAWKGETESIRQLVEDGRDIDEQVEGNSEENPIVNKADNGGFPPNLAVELQNEEVMKVPLASAAQPDALNNEGKGELHDACIKGDLNAIRVVINAGADVDIKSNHHSTPLLLAAENGHHPSVEKLVALGADPTNDGDSLVPIASSGLNAEVNDEFDGILKKIARALYKYSDIDKLGTHLGFQPADIGRYNDANAQQGGSWMGTLDMLRTWQKGQTKSKQRAALRSALIDSGFQQLAHEHLGTCSAEEETIPEHLQKIGDSQMPSGIDSTLAAPGSAEGQTKTHDTTAATDQSCLHDQSSENHGDEASECMEQFSENSSINNLTDEEQETPSGVSSIKEPFDEEPDTSYAKGVEYITTNYSDFLSYLALTETSSDKLLMLLVMKVFVDVWFGSFG